MINRIWFNVLWIGCLFGGCINPYINLAVPTPVARPTTYLYPVKDKVNFAEKIIVKDVTEGRPMAVAGVQVGDEIISVDGKKFDIVENFFKYILEVDKTMEFKLKRNSNEITIQVDPMQDRPKLGFESSYYDKDGNEIFPTYLGYADNVTGTDSYATPVDYIAQRQKTSEVSCGTAMFGRVLFFRLMVKNLSAGDLKFMPAEALQIVTAQSRVLQAISDAKVASLVGTSPMVASSENVTHIILPGTYKEMMVYFDTEKGVASNDLPYSVHITVSEEKYWFKFDTKRNISYQHKT